MLHSIDIQEMRHFWGDEIEVEVDFVEVDFVELVSLTCTDTNRCKHPFASKS